jgi:hypothetical protein
VEVHERDATAWVWPSPYERNAEGRTSEARVERGERGGEKIEKRRKRGLTGGVK